MLLSLEPSGLLVGVVLFLLTGNWIFVSGIVAMHSLYARFGRVGDQLQKKSPILETTTTVTAATSDKN